MMCASVGCAHRSGARAGRRARRCRCRRAAARPRAAVAPRSRSDSSVRSYVGRSTITSSPGLHEVLEQERVGLHRAVGDQHALGLDAVAVGDPAAQARVADGRAVCGRARRVALERAHGRVAQALDVDDVQRRGAAREGDRGAGRALTQRRSLGVRAARRSRGSARAPSAPGGRGSAAARRRSVVREPPGGGGRGCVGVAGALRAGAAACSSRARGSREPRAGGGPAGPARWRLDRLVDDPARAGRLGDAAGGALARSAALLRRR